MDVDKLIKALDNDQNEYLINLTTKKINDMKIEILKELQLSKIELNEFINKLREYRYVDGMNEIRYGAYIRWIPINDPDNIHLTTGGIICDIKVLDKGVSIICKNFAKKHYQIKMDECLIFQKISSQEQVLLSALDHLSSTN